MAAAMLDDGALLGGRVKLSHLRASFQARPSAHLDQVGADRTPKSSST
jgi:hypothetical protein